MAAKFRVVSQSRTVAVRSPGVVQDVMEFYSETLPSHVGFVRDVAYTVWKKKGVLPLLEPIAEHIEHILANRPVISAGPVQEVGRNGVITNAVEFLIHGPPSLGADAVNHTTTVTIPVQDLHDRDDFTSYFAPALEALEAAGKL